MTEREKWEQKGNGQSWLDWCEALDPLEMQEARQLMATKLEHVLALELLGMDCADLRRQLIEKGEGGKD